MYTVSTKIDLVERQIIDSALLSPSEAISIAMQILRNEGIISEELTIYHLQSSAL